MNWRVTLRQWIDLDEATRTELLNRYPTTMPRRGFNEQKGMDIDWGAMVNVGVWGQAAACSSAACMGSPSRKRTPWITWASRCEPSSRRQLRSADLASL
jgi:hypothetical protein